MSVRNPRADADVPTLLAWLSRNNWSVSVLSRWPKPALVRLIEHLDRLYWDGQDTGVSDSGYDLLIQALTKKDPEHPLIHRVNG